MQDPDDAALMAALDESRHRFLALVASVRPQLHRYCARMLGSVTAGEDAVQDTLAKAYFQLPELHELPPLQPWLFRIARNVTIDTLRREALRRTEAIDAAAEVAADERDAPESRFARRQATAAAIATFSALPPSQRACVVLMDVLEYTLNEVAAQLEMTVPAVKAALQRGRAGLRQAMTATPRTSSPPAVSADLRRYTQLFNAHDWTGVRSMLTEDVRLDLVSRRRLAGKASVGGYFSNYDSIAGWTLKPAWLDGQEVAAVFTEDDAARPRYVVVVTFEAGRIAGIRDFRYVPYIGAEADIVCADGP